MRPLRPALVGALLAGGLVVSTTAPAQAEEQTADCTAFVNVEVDPEITYATTATSLPLA